MKTRQGDGFRDRRLLGRPRKTGRFHEVRRRTRYRGEDIDKPASRDGGCVRPPDRTLRADLMTREHLHMELPCWTTSSSANEPTSGPRRLLALATAFRRTVLPGGLARIVIVRVARCAGRRAFEHAVSIGLNQPQLVAAW